MEKAFGQTGRRGEAPALIVPRFSVLVI